MHAVVVAFAGPDGGAGIETRHAAAQDADLTVSRLPHADPVETTVSGGAPRGRVLVGAHRACGQVSRTCANELGVHQRAPEIGRTRAHVAPIAFAKQRTAPALEAMHLAAGRRSAALEVVDTRLARTQAPRRLDAVQNRPSVVVVAESIAVRVGGSRREAPLRRRRRVAACEDGLEDLGQCRDAAIQTLEEDDPERVRVTRRFVQALESRELQRLRARRRSGVAPSVARTPSVSRRIRIDRCSVSRLASSIPRRVDRRPIRPHDRSVAPAFPFEGSRARAAVRDRKQNHSQEPRRERRRPACRSSCTHASSRSKKRAREAVVRVPRIAEKS